MTNSLTQDLSTITTIPKSQLDNLFAKIAIVLCHNLSESIARGEDISSLDTGFGTLLIGIDGAEVKYKFIPSSSLDDKVKNTIKTGESPLITAVEEKLKERITNTYKDIL